ncbi:MAG: flagellar hook-length control protein FliK, partial [Gammaproteobacteria bacterium]|nr:flagellar hook-length control protein FliK [Gammaproteobacteria bacterium]
PALQPLLQLITRFPEIDASALKKWLEFARLIYKPKSEAGTSTPVDIFRVLKQFSDGESFSRELAHVLKQNPRATTDADAPATRAAAQEALLQQVREGVKLVEQSLSHNLLQRATLGLQQETQQPFSLSLALPFLQDQQTRTLYIDLEQRKRAQQEEDKSWDIRLNFELAGLGPVSCHLVLEGHAVGASFYCERAQTRERIEMELPLLRQQLTSAGFTPGEFHSFPGKLAPDRTPTTSDFAESLIDIEV